MDHLSSPLGPLRELALFAGAGGGILGGKLLGWRCVCAVEWEPYPAGVLVQRQNDGILPPFPVWDDVRTFDGTPWRGLVDVVSGGFPCFTAGTLILTHRGHIPIEDVVVGDRVLTHAGRWRRVTSTMRRRARSTRVISGSGFLPIRTTDEHPFYARTRAPGRTLYLRDAEWTGAAALVPGRHYVAGVVPVRRTADRRGPDFWWIVGRYLADGWRTVSNGKGRVVICCNRGEADGLEQRIRRVFHCTRSEERTVVKFHICRKDFYEFLTQFRDGAEHKLIPGKYLGLPDAAAEALLDGYLTGDGCRTQGRWKCTTISRALALAVVALALRARGVVASIYESAHAEPTCLIEGRRVNRRTQYQVVIPDGNGSAVVDGIYGWRRVRRSEWAPGRYVFNLSVEGDESYVADGVVVHNCQDISAAGKGAGLAGERSGLWTQMARVISEVEPRYVLVENSPLLVGRGLDVVLADLASMGFDVRWGVVGACDVGAPHQRDRIWILAHACEIRQPRHVGEQQLPRPGVVG